MGLPVNIGPADLVGWLASQCATRVHCVECGAGHGEISAFLAPRFHTVTATDIRPPRRAVSGAGAAGFVYLSASAEKLPFDDQSVDLVVSMQALHHFDVEKHVEEAARILRPNGVFAALAWGEMQLPDEVAARYGPVFRALKPYWEPERAWVTGGYADLAFPGQPLPLPKTRMMKKLRYDDLDRHISGWTASQAAARAGNPAPKIQLSEPTRVLADPFVAEWPVVGRAFRIRSRPQPQYRPQSQSQPL